MNTQRKRALARMKKYLVEKQHHEAARRAGLTSTPGFKPYTITTPAGAAMLDYDQIGWKKKNVPYIVIMD